MSEDSHRKHVFISHHHADDLSVSKLQMFLARSGYDVRNSSIRATAKPANQERLDKGLIREATLRRLLRQRIAWAKTTIVLVGKETHSRPWVNWEIEQAYRQGKRIVGLYDRGASESDLPENLKKYGSSCVGWNSDSIISAINGTDKPFEKPDGSNAIPISSTHINC